MKINKLRLICACLSALLLCSCGDASAPPEESITQETAYTDSDTEKVTEQQAAESEDASEAETEGEVGTESPTDAESKTDTENETETENPKKEPSLMITSPAGEVFPYADAALHYLQAGADANVSDYFIYMKNPNKAITLKWSLENSQADSYLVEYSTSKELDGAISVSLSGNVNSLDLYNLFKASEYFVRITAYRGGEVIATADHSFTTTSLGPRVMSVDGIYNVRDLGGYPAEGGKTTLQGKLFRGGALYPVSVYDCSLTDEGAKYMSETMGIKTEIDLRTPAESGVKGASLITGASLVYIPLGAYSDAYSSSAVGSEAYRALFSTLANDNNYPIYYHCTGGADRTGTVSFLLNALLGVSEKELINDYEFTSFSAFNQRNSKTGEYSTYFIPFRKALDGFEGDTLSEKTENYMLSIGVTEDEIHNIKAIMLGGEIRTVVSAQSSFVRGVDKSFAISLSGDKTPDKLILGGIETEFERTYNGLAVQSTKMPSLTEGETQCKLVFKDGVEIGFSFTYGESSLTELDEYMDFGADGKLTLDASCPKIQGTAPTGYGKDICIRMTSDMPSDSHGGIYVLVGSYGILLRGGEFRTVQMTADGTITETARNTGFAYPQTAFNSGTTLLYLRVEHKDGKPTLHIKAGTEGNMREYFYTYSSPIAGEIPDADATVTFQINTSSVKSLTVYSSEGK